MVRKRGRKSKKNADPTPAALVKRSNALASEGRASVRVSAPSKRETKARTVLPKRVTDKPKRRDPREWGSLYGQSSSFSTRETPKKKTSTSPLNVWYLTNGAPDFTPFGVRRRVTSIDRADEPRKRMAKDTSVEEINENDDVVGSSSWNEWYPDSIAMDLTQSAPPKKDATDDETKRHTSEDLESVLRAVRKEKRVSDAFEKTMKRAMPSR